MRPFIFSLLMAFLAVTVQADQLSNTFKMGNGTQSNKRIILNRGGSNPEIRWNETTDKLQFSNDGSAFENIGTLQSEPNLLENIGASFSQGSGNLTMNLKQADGSTDPATDGPLRVAMRSSTITSGAYNVRSRTTAASLVIDNGATMGFASAATEYLYWYLLDNSGTLEIAVSKSLFDDGALASTTAMSNAADSGVVMYSTTGRSNVPIRLFMRTKHSLTTAGSWDEVPDAVTFLPAVKAETVAARIGAAGPTIDQIIGGWISSITDHGTGDHTLNMPSGYWAEAPICTVSPVNGTGNRSCEITTGATATAVRIKCTDGTSAADETFTVSCTGYR